MLADRQARDLDPDNESANAAANPRVAARAA